MTTATQQRRSPWPLFPDKPAPPLYDRIVKIRGVRHYSRRTKEAHVHRIRRHIGFHQHRHPSELAEYNPNQFLTNLAVNEHVALPITELGFKE